MRLTVVRASVKPGKAGLLDLPSEATGLTGYPKNAPTFFGLSLRGSRVADLRVLEPLGPAFALAAARVEVCRLQLLCHRPGRPDLAVVDLADRRHLGGGAGHEDLVRSDEVGPDEVRLLDGVAEVLRDLDQRVARDAGQDRGRERRRRDLPVLDD